MIRRSFREVWEAHSGLYSAKHDAYLDIYEHWLSPFIGRQVTLIEFGVLKGGSLQIWSEYLGLDARIVGVDRVADASWSELGYGIEPMVGDQQDIKLLERLPETDIVIDDAGHMPGPQIVTFDYMWRKVRPGGLYVIEDLMPRNVNCVRHIVDACYMKWPVHIHKEILAVYKIDESMEIAQTGRAP